MKKVFLLTALPLLIMGVGCMKLTTENAIEVKPIHITIDVNVKVDKALDDFFGDIDDAHAETTAK